MEEAKMVKPISRIPYMKEGSPSGSPFFLPAAGGLRPPRPPKFLLVFCAPFAPRS